MKADASTEAEVRATLNQFADTYMERDMDGLLALFAPDSDVMVYGTGADEKRVGKPEIKAQTERDWAQSDSDTVTYGWTSISAAGSVAWAASDITFGATIGGEEYSFPARLTTVLEKRGDQWLIVHGHFSFPAADQAEGESFPHE